MSETQPSLTLVRRIKAPPAALFAAWTRPERMVLWWGPDAGPVLSAEADPTPGGRFRVVFETLDGRRHDCGGVYRTVEADRLLVFSWRWASMPEQETLVTVALRPIPEGTELTLTHARFADETACDGHRRGWSGMLDKLDAYAAEIIETTEGDRP